MSGARPDCQGIRTRAANGCQRSWVGSHPMLRAPDVCDTSIRATPREGSYSGWPTRRCHSEVRRIGHRAPGCESAHTAWRGRHAFRCTPRQVATTSSHNTRAIATRAFARPFVTARRRAHRPRADPEPAHAAGPSEPHPAGPFRFDRASTRRHPGRPRAARAVGSSSSTTVDHSGEPAGRVGEVWFWPTRLTSMAFT